MTITLSLEAQKLLELRMKHGDYAAPEDVVLAGLHALEAEDEMSPEELEELKRELAMGVEDIEQGRVVEWNAEAFRARAMERLEGSSKVR